MRGIEGKVCVVTGASSGIGEATARALADRGATLVLAARREDLLRSLAEDISRRGREATWARVDVTRTEDLEALRDHVRDRHGRCDALINNAGVPGGGSFADLSPERIRLVTETNYVSVTLATRLFLDLLVQSRGHVVNVASLAGRYALPGAAVYTASKHAVVALTQSLLCDTSVKDVRFTAVCPGFVRTPGFPHENPPWFVTVSLDKVAEVITEVIARSREGIVSIPAWPGPLSAVQALAPRLYTSVAGLLAQRYAPRVHSD